MYGGCLLCPLYPLFFLMVFDQPHLEARLKTSRCSVIIQAVDPERNWKPSKWSSTVNLYKKFINWYETALLNTLPNPWWRHNLGRSFLLLSILKKKEQTREEQRASVTSLIKYFSLSPPKRCFQCQRERSWEEGWRGKGGGGIVPSLFPAFMFSIIHACILGFFPLYSLQIFLLPFFSFLCLIFIFAICLAVSSTLLYGPTKIYK